MKKLILLMMFISLFAFEVEFTKIYKEYIIPKKDGVFIKTSKNNLSFPFKCQKVKDGYILIGDTNEINMWLNNDFYAPEDAVFKNIKIAYLNQDIIQYNLIRKIKNTYKNCEIKKIIFLTPDEDMIITKPKTIKLEYKIILNCK